MVEARRLYPDFDVTRSWALPDVPVQPGDESLDSYLRRMGFTDAQLDYTRRAYVNAAGDDMADLSAEACREEWADTTAGQGDFRILNGYDGLLEDLARGLSVRLNTVIERLDWGVGGVRVYSAGEVFEANRAVITLPLGVLQSGSVRFVPELPPEKQAAIHALRMGPGIKLVYQFEQPVLPPGIMALYSAGAPPMWWSPSFGQDISKTVVTAFATGSYARDLLACGEAGALEAALNTLRGELNRPDLKPLNAHLANWADDPYSLGGYSVVPPGQAGARAALAQPVADRLFWAGEAAAPNAWGATVHGAYASGQRAAREIISTF